MVRRSLRMNFCYFNGNNRVNAYAVTAMKIYNERYCIHLGPYCYWAPLIVRAGVWFGVFTAFVPLLQEEEFTLYTGQSIILL